MIKLKDREGVCDAALTGRVAALEGGGGSVRERSTAVAERESALREREVVAEGRKREVSALRNEACTHVAPNVNPESRNLKPGPAKHPTS